MDKYDKLYKKACDVYADTSQLGHTKTKKNDDHSHDQVKEKPVLKKKISNLNAGLPPKSTKLNARAPVTPSINCNMK